MKPIQTLLIATDFSTAAKRAEERAAQLASEHDARLIVLHNLSSLGFQRLRERLTLGYASTEAQLLKHYQDALQRLADDLTGRWQIAVTPLLTVGQAHREISRAAGESGVDLVVVGAMGEHPARALFLGSTAERVVREASAPILVVWNETGEAYSRALVALDLSLHSPTVLEHARRVAPTAHFTVGHAFEVPFEGKLLFAGASQEEIDRYRREEREQALETLHTLTKEMKSIPDIRVEHGMADVVLPQLIQETAADLVVTGKHGRSEIIDFLLGSLTKHLLRESGRDVLVVPPTLESKTISEARLQHDGARFQP